MKLFRRRSVKATKKEIARITKEMDNIEFTPFMANSDFMLWNDYNSKLTACEWFLYLIDEL